MRGPVIIDTGPLVALLDRRDLHHTWVASELATIAPPVLTCEAVVAEAYVLLHRVTGGPAALTTLLSRPGAIRIDFDLSTNLKPVIALLGHYQSVPMSLTHACTICMADRHPGSSVLTLDSDFEIYRNLQGQPIPAIVPPLWRQSRIEPVFDLASNYRVDRGSTDLRQ